MAVAKASGGEPSMEEILSSIKKIIAEETDTESPAAAVAADEPPVPSSDEDDGILELTDMVELEEVPEASTDILDDMDNLKSEPVAEAEPEPEPEPMPEPVFTPPPPAPEPAPIMNNIAGDEGLLSENTIKKSSSEIESLLKSVHKQPAAKHGGSAHFRSGETVEDLVIELLRPMLSEWLDENLPELVRKIVEKEIRRIVPG